MYFRYKVTCIQELKLLFMADFVWVHFSPLVPLQQPRSFSCSSFTLFFAIPTTIFQEFPKELGNMACTLRRYKNEFPFSFLFLSIISRVSWNFGCNIFSNSLIFDHLALKVYCQQQLNSVKPETKPGVMFDKYLPIYPLANWSNNEALIWNYFEGKVYTWLSYELWHNY